MEESNWILVRIASDWNQKSATWVLRKISLPMIGLVNYDIWWVKYSVRGREEGGADVWFTKNIKCIW